MALHEVELVFNHRLLKLPARQQAHDLAVNQSGGTFTDTDPYEALRGRGRGAPKTSAPGRGAGRCKKKRGAKQGSIQRPFPSFLAIEPLQ
jgi:hypothetical protein